MEPTRPFSQVLIEQRTGGLHNELTEKLQEMVAAVEEHGKQGTLTLTLTVKPAAKGTNQFVVTDDVKVRVPEAERGASLFFGDGHGGLTRSNPHQPELPLREAPAPATELREAT